MKLLRLPPRSEEPHGRAVRSARQTAGDRRQRRFAQAAMSAGVAAADCAEIDLTAAENRRIIRTTKSRAEDTVRV